MNSILPQLFKTKFKDKSDFFIYEELSKSGANEVRNKVEEVAVKNGMISLPDTSELILMCKFFDTANWTHSSFPTAQLGDKTGVNSNGLRLWEQAMILMSY
jgi:hypothetical protein